MTDPSAGAALPERVAAAVRGGVDWVQIRDRESGGAALVTLGDAIVRAVRHAAAAQGRDVSVLVNRRCDVALAIGADGVHLGFDAVSPAIARTLLGPSALIGVSAHTASEARELPDDVNYAHLAPIFEPISKTSGREPLGLATLADGAAGPPLLAQGGITPERASAVRRSGAAGVAVTGAILMADDPQAAAAALRAALDR